MSNDNNNNKTIQAPVLITEPGSDTTTKSTTPDFEGGKGYHWMKQSYHARLNGTSDTLPRKERASLAERSFFDAVDRRLSRSSAIVNISFDKDGRRIRE